VECLESDLGRKIEKLKVDGGVTQSDFIMQQQSDFLGMTLEKPHMSELTARGAAIAAGLGIGVWPSHKDISFDPSTRCTLFSPNIEKSDADHRYRHWLCLLQNEMKA
jgi:glycerol kinase